jgi:indolepyruvate ferredoxin oxidoreductase
MWTIEGRIPERVLERELIDERQGTVAHLLDHLDADNLAAAVALAAVPDGIRDYGPVKEMSVVMARAKRQSKVGAGDTAAIRPERPTLNLRRLQ